MKTKILFLCTGNSCRSQIAEAWARCLKSNEVEAHSAGVAPNGVDPRAVRVMKEAGVDISGQRSKSVEEFMDREFDYVVTLCGHVEEFMDREFDYVVTLCGHAQESCPVFPGRTKVVHVGFDDPPQLAQNAADEEEALNAYRRVRDEIKAFVERLPAALEMA